MCWNAHHNVIFTCTLVQWHCSIMRKSHQCQSNFTSCTRGYGIPSSIQMIPMRRVSVSRQLTFWRTAVWLTTKPYWANLSRTIQRGPRALTIFSSTFCRPFPSTRAWRPASKGSRLATVLSHHHLCAIQPFVLVLTSPFLTTLTPFATLTRSKSPMAMMGGWRLDITDIWISHIWTSSYIWIFMSKCKLYPKVKFLYIQRISVSKNENKQYPNVKCVQKRNVMSKCLK